jgi:hypothetical protein
MMAAAPIRCFIGSHSVDISHSRRRTVGSERDVLGDHLPHRLPETSTLAGLIVISFRNIPAIGLHSAGIRSW